MEVATLGADISDTAHVATEDGLEELLQTLPFAGSLMAKETRELEVVFETVVESINNPADPGAASERDKARRRRSSVTAPQGCVPHRDRCTQRGPRE
jgi:hypothetical protein